METTAGTKETVWVISETMWIRLDKTVAR